MGEKRKNSRKRFMVFLAGLLWTFVLFSGRTVVYADDEPEEIYFSEAQVKMAPATIKKLTLVGAESSGIVWKSSDKKIAAVDHLGAVTAKAKGNATITALYQDKEYTCAVKVAYETVKVADGMEYKDAKGTFGYTGRWFKKNIGGGKNYFTNTDGSAIYFKATGSKYVNVNFASNTVRGIPYFAYSVDGGKMNRQLISKKKIKIGNSKKTHYVRLLIDATSEYENRWFGEAGVAVKQIKPVTKSGVVTAVKPLNETIAFYGDSITKGVRALGMGTPSGTSVTNGYAWHCASQLKMTPYFAGFGATGIIQTGTADSCINVIQKFSAGRKASAYQADVIVIEHGTNDVYTHGDIYVNEYRRVVELLHSQQPKAKVMAMIPLNQIHADDIRRVAQSYEWCEAVETSSLKVAYTDGIHPNASGSKKMGKYLAKQIRAARKR